MQRVSSGSYQVYRGWNVKLFESETVLLLQRSIKASDPFGVPYIWCSLLNKSPDFDFDPPGFHFVHCSLWGFSCVFSAPCVPLRFTPQTDYLTLSCRILRINLEFLDFDAGKWVLPPSLWPKEDKGCSISVLSIHKHMYNKNEGCLWVIWAFTWFIYHMHVVGLWRGTTWRKHYSVTSAEIFFEYISDYKSSLSIPLSCDSRSPQPPTTTFQKESNLRRLSRGAPGCQSITLHGG